MQAKHALMGAVSGLAFGIAALGGGSAHAQQAFTRIQAFGDSYVDIGRALAFAPNPLVYPTGRFSGGTNYIDTISSILGIPQNNFGFGGAQSGATNITGAGIGFTQEYQGFIGSGMRIAPTDLTVINIGGNDALGYALVGSPPAGVAAAAAATATAAQTLTGVNALVNDGARTLVFTAGNVGTLPILAGTAGASLGSAYSQLANAQVQTGLAAIAASGVRVEYVDISLIGSQVAANPARFGFASAGQCPLTCIGNPALQNQYLFYVDGVHLTSHGFAVLGQYVVNRLQAPATFAPQTEGATVTAFAFAQTLFGRMDTFRGTDGGYQGQVEAAPPRYTKGPLPAPVPVFANPFSAYILVDGAVGDGARTTTGAGYSVSEIGGTVGGEYQLGPHALIGAAFNYDNPRLKLNTLNATSRSDSYQFGGYATFANADFFAQGLAIGGFQSYRNTRAGVVDTVTSSPDGTTFAAGGKIGKLFGFGGFRAGPIGDLLYGRAQINRFTEAGDPALTLAVNKQVQEALLVGGGAQIRVPLSFGATRLDPYLNLTAESEVLGNGRIIQYDATSAPIIVNNLNVPDTTSGRVYGRIAGGVQAAVTSNIALSLFATTTLGRRGGDDFSGAGGLKISF